MELEEAKTRRALSLRHAIDRATQYFGFDGVVEIDEGGEVFRVPMKTLRSAEQIKAVNELAELVKTCDHDDVVQRNPVTNEIVTHPQTGLPVVDREIRLPHSMDGVLLDPPYEWRYAAAILGGGDAMKRFEAAGGTPGHVYLLEAQMDAQFEDWRRARQGRDPKSVDRVPDVAVVQPGDRV